MPRMLFRRVSSRFSIVFKSVATVKSARIYSLVSASRTKLFFSKDFLKKMLQNNTNKIQGYLFTSRPSPFPSTVTDMPSISSGLIQSVSFSIAMAFPSRVKIILVVLIGNLFIYYC